MQTCASSEAHCTCCWGPMDVARCGGVQMACELRYMQTLHMRLANTIPLIPNFFSMHACILPTALHTALQQGCASALRYHSRAAEQLRVRHLLHPMHGWHT